MQNFTLPVSCSRRSFQRGDGSLQVLLCHPQLVFAVFAAFAAFAKAHTFGQCSSQRFVVRGNDARCTMHDARFTCGMEYGVQRCGTPEALALTSNNQLSCVSKAEKVSRMVNVDGKLVNMPARDKPL